MEHMKVVRLASRKVDMKEVEREVDSLTVQLMAIQMEHHLVVKRTLLKEKTKEYY